MPLVPTSSAPENPTPNPPGDPRLLMIPFEWGAQRLWNDVELLTRGNRGLVLAHGAGAPLAVLTALAARCGPLCVARIIDEPLPPDRDSLFDYLSENPADIHVVLNPENNIPTSEAWDTLGEWARLDRWWRSVPVTTAFPDVCQVAQGRFHGGPDEPAKDETDANPNLTGGILLVAPDVIDPSPMLTKLGWEVPLQPWRRNAEVRAVEAPPAPPLPVISDAETKNPAVLLNPSASRTVAAVLGAAWAPRSEPSAEELATTAETLARLCGLEFKPVYWRGICEEDYEFGPDELPIDYEEPLEENPDAAFCYDEDEFDGAYDSEAELFDPDRLDRELFADVEPDEEWV